MDQQPQSPDLFDVKLNASGRHYIRKFVGVARIMILIGVIVTLLNLTVTVFRYIDLDYSFYGDRLLRFEVRVWPFYVFVYSFLFCLQIYYYWKLGVCLKKSTEYNDEALFNQSFAELYRNASIGLVVVCVTLIMEILELIIAIRIY